MWMIADPAAYVNVVSRADPGFPVAILTYPSALSSMPYVFSHSRVISSLTPTVCLFESVSDATFDRVVRSPAIDTTFLGVPKAQTLFKRLILAPFKESAVMYR